MSDKLPNPEIVTLPVANAKRRGNKPVGAFSHKKTAKTIEMVIRMVACKYPQTEICKKLGITPRRFRDRYAEEMEYALQISNARVAENLLKVATTFRHKNNVQAAFKWLSVQAGWHDPNTLSAVAIAAVESAKQMIAALQAKDITPDKAGEMFKDWSQKPRGNGTLNS
jgi:hypothetical protein